MHVLLSDDADVLEREGKAKHDEVCVCSIETVGVVGVEVLGIGADVLHDFVLSFSGGV